MCGTKSSAPAEATTTAKPEQSQPIKIMFRKLSTNNFQFQFCKAKNHAYVNRFGAVVRNSVAVQVNAAGSTTAQFKHLCAWT